jgi:hypothetical protein
MDETGYIVAGEKFLVHNIGIDTIPMISKALFSFSFPHNLLTSYYQTTRGGARG